MTHFAVLGIQTVLAAKNVPITIIWIKEADAKSSVISVKLGTKKQAGVQVVSHLMEIQLMEYAQEPLSIMEETLEETITMTTTVSSTDISTPKTNGTQLSSMVAKKSAKYADKDTISIQTSNANF